MQLQNNPVKPGQKGQVMGLVTMERVCLVFGLGLLLLGTGARAESVVEVQAAGIPFVFSPNMLPVTLLGCLLVLSGFLYKAARG